MKKDERLYRLAGADLFYCSLTIAWQVQIKPQLRPNGNPSFWIIEEWTTIDTPCDHAPLDAVDQHVANWRVTLDSNSGPQYEISQIFNSSYQSWSKRRN